MPTPPAVTLGEGDGEGNGLASTCSKACNTWQVRRGAEGGSEGPPHNACVRGCDAWEGEGGG
jgi:hypothetical protein